MKIVESAQEMRDTARMLRAQGRRIGLVPTMGNLHDGHLSLIRIAKRQADAVAVSIFVNPAQFGPREDFAAYPRTFEADCALCEREGVDLVFHPSAEEMYPEGASTAVTEKALSRDLCGASRPGHFDGVCTVVAALFHIVQPQLAVFGEKDAQQLRVIRRMVRDLHFPIEIVPGPTVREADGLALSSRNQHLTPAQRGQAVCLLKDAMRARIAREPDARIDYVEIADDDTLTPLDGPITRPALAALAVRIGQPRLIDNTVLRP
jgi:pantoate--beta-alanine ligase